MAESTTSEKRLAGAENQRKALELRKAGFGFQAIADQLGYGGPSGAYQAVKAALKKTLQEPADEVRALELERLDQAWKAVYPQMLKGNFGAIDRGLRIMQRRAEYLGLDAPKDSRLNVSGNLTREYVVVRPGEQTGDGA